jgi:hypothetical protein
MATATRKVPATVELPTVEPTSLSLVDGPHSDYRCTCGHALRVFGGGRHRIYFEPANTQLDDPVMNRICPQCGDTLPGKNHA